MKEYGKIKTIFKRDFKTKELINIKEIENEKEN